MKRFVAVLNKYDQVIGGCIILIGITGYVIYKVNNTKNNGVLTIAKVTGYESSESGSDLYIDIFWQDTVYKTSVDQACERDCIGNFFFVEIIENNPLNYPIFYGDRQVPACIVNNVKCFKGWKSFPDCNNYK